MKATVQCLNLPVTDVKSWLEIFADLAKVRLTSLVVLSCAAGFYMGADALVDWWLMLHTMIGTALLASGASALNQYLERDYDARMRRTQDRPLPAGRLLPANARLFGLACGATGVVYLATMVNGQASLIGAITALLYLGLYTPLKRYTWLNTLIGAIPGGLPPMIGWAGARHDLSTAGWILFLVQFCWQIPHFLSIAWIYREDYAHAGFAMLPGIDPNGRLTGWLSMGFGAALVIASLMPVSAGWCGRVYLGWALLLGAAMLTYTLRFCQHSTRENARKMFLASIVYLPFLFSLMVACKKAS